MLAIVSRYGTIQAITDAIVPVGRRDEQSGEPLCRHFRYLRGKPHPTLTDRGSPLAFLNHEHLHRTLNQQENAARKVLKRKSLPVDLRDSVAGFRLIRASRRRHKTIPEMLVQQWDVFTIDETITRDTHPGKPPIIDPKKSLSLEMSLQCPPIFEMYPRGFIPQLMRDLAKFMGASEPFQSETTVAARYKLWQASETVEQFNVMFQYEEEQRKELIEAARDNLTVAPMRQALQKGEKPNRGYHLPINSSETGPRFKRKSPVADFGGFGLATQDIEEQRNAEADQQAEARPSRKAAAIIEVEEDEDNDAGSFGIASLPVVEQDAIVSGATQEESQNRPPRQGW